MAIVRPGASVLPAPTAAQLVQQPWGTSWCGPAAFVTLHRLLRSQDYDLEAAKRDLCGTWTDGGTSAERMVAYFQTRGMRASLLAAQPSGMAEAMAVALRGGAYVVPIGFTLPGVATAEGHPATHFLIVYGVKDGLILIADSLERPGGRIYAITEREFETTWAAPVARFGLGCPFLIVRRA